MMSPLMSVQLPRPLNGKNKRGILDIRAIVWAATHGCPRVPRTADNYSARVLPGTKVWSLAPPMCQDVLTFFFF